MKLNVLGLTVCSALFLVGCSNLEPQSYSQSAKNSNAVGNPQPVIPPDLEAAIATAKGDAVKTYGSIDGYKIIPCEHPMFWLVFFDPQIDSPDGMGLYYSISKVTHQIVHSRRIKLANGAEKMEDSTLPEGPVTKEQALTIVKRDAHAATASLSTYDLTICELSRAWRITYSPKARLSGSGPEYVVDKKTGAFLEKAFYQ